ncbi:MAG TPA: sce7726 family protein [Candidatus Limnocylindrales bacterium]|nr:sce7726 family protein [Candidatus Limnocylindrales bacterium]
MPRVPRPPSVGQLSLGLFDDGWALRDALINHLAHVEPRASLIPELGVDHGTARIDLAAVDQTLDGFEIKGRGDDLRRLPRQVAAFGPVFDRLSLVVDRQHLDAAKSALPAWWGIFVADSATGTICIARDPAWNPGLQPLAMASLLWSEELRDELASHGGVSARATAQDMRKRLVASLARDDLRTVVRRRLTVRQGWRAA